jgi:hypothetical protein
VNCNSNKADEESFYKYLRKVLDQAHIELDEVANKTFLVNGSNININSNLNENHSSSDFRKNSINISTLEENDISRKQSNIYLNNICANKLMLGDSQIHVGRIEYRKASCSKFSIYDLNDMNKKDSIEEVDSNEVSNPKFFIQNDSNEMYSPKLEEDVFDLISKKRPSVFTQYRSKENLSVENTQAQSNQTINIISPFRFGSMNNLNKL